MARVVVTGWIPADALTSLQGHEVEVWPEGQAQTAEPRFAFVHGAIHRLPDGLLLADSYHVSRYNTSTRRLTPAMFEAAVSALLARLASG